MGELVPRCPMCGLEASLLGSANGFRHFSFHYLCPDCRQRVLAAGDARSRRMQVTARRVETLFSRFEGLYIEERAAHRASVRGLVEQRRVWVTIKDAARQGECERFVVRVELGHNHTDDAPFAIAELSAKACRGSPRRVTDDGHWLWAGFRHLGNKDIIHVVEVMCAAAARIEAS
jgi:hypothetical protein